MSSVRVTLVIVDESGVMKAMLRMDRTPLVSVQTAMNKAYAARMRADSLRENRRCNARDAAVAARCSGCSGNPSVAGCGRCGR
jgi:uncharacterized protein GlcG (DUF336 family)